MESVPNSHANNRTFKNLPEVNAKARDVSLKAKDSTLDAKATLSSRSSTWPRGLQHGLVGWYKDTVIVIHVFLV